MTSIMRVGIPKPSAAFADAARTLAVPVLFSANAFHRGDGSFRTGSLVKLAGLDAALDSAGFVAMMRYHGYPWSIETYLALAAAHPWAWWASMDYCCEPEIARNRAEVLSRVDRTAAQYKVIATMAADRGMAGLLPVFQGWHPDDYRRCAEQMQLAAGLVGLGSVCRRDLHGPAGVAAVLDALDRALPPSIRLHLFGVKTDVMRAIALHPRVASFDSMAWDYRARRDLEPPRTEIKRAAYMGRWVERQAWRLDRPLAIQRQLDI